MIGKGLCAIPSAVATARQLWRRRTAALRVIKCSARQLWRRASVVVNRPTFAALSRILQMVNGARRHDDLTNYSISPLVTRRSRSKQTHG